MYRHIVTKKTCQGATNKNTNTRKKSNVLIQQILKICKEKMKISEKMEGKS